MSAHDSTARLTKSVSAQQPRKTGRPARIEIDVLIERNCAEMVLARDRQAILEADIAKLARLRSADAKIQAEIAAVEADLCALCAQDESRIRALRAQNAEACGCAA